MEVKTLKFQASCVLYDIDPENLEKFKNWNPASEYDVCNSRGGCDTASIASRRNHDECLSKYSLDKLFNKIIMKGPHKIIPYLEKFKNNLSKFNYEVMFVAFCRKGLIKEIKCLIDNKLLEFSDINLLVNNQFPRVFVGHEVIWELLKYDQILCTPELIFDAFTTKLDSIVEPILNHPNVTTEIMSEVFIMACIKSLRSTIKYLLSIPKVNPAYDNQRALLRAADRGAWEIIELLAADPRIDVNYNNGEFLTRLCSYGCVMLVKQAIKVYKCDPCLNDHSALYAAIGRDNRAITDYLINLPEVIADLNINHPMLRFNYQQKLFLEKIKIFKEIFEAIVRDIDLKINN